MIQKPMLASAIKDINMLTFPLIASPKLDGVRCLKVDGKVVTRSFKPIKNDYIRGILEKVLPEGADGEIMSPSGNFQEISGGVRRVWGEPEFYFAMFDLVGEDSNEPYCARLLNMESFFVDFNCHPDFLEHIRLVDYVTIYNVEELLAYEERCLEEGYEGVMTRTPDSPYKYGRSSVNQQWLLKFKRFIDSEAVIIGFEEEMHNDNVAEKDEFGRTKRSSAKDGKTGKGRLGALRVRELKTGIEFKLGTGFNHAQRQQVWDDREILMNEIVKYKSQPTGVKEKPRFPVFLGFRDIDDM